MATPVLTILSLQQSFARPWYFPRTPETCAITLAPVTHTHSGAATAVPINVGKKQDKSLKDLFQYILPLTYWPAVFSGWCPPHKRPAVFSGWCPPPKRPPHTHQFITALGLPGSSHSSRFVSQIQPSLFFKSFSRVDFVNRHLRPC